MSFETNFVDTNVERPNVQGLRICGARGPTIFYILVGQLTLSKSGGQVMLTTVLLSTYPPAPRIFRPSNGPDVEGQGVNLSSNGHWYQSTFISQEGKYIFYLVKLAKKLETLTDCFLLLQYVLNRIESNQFIPEFFLHDIVW